MILTVEKFDKIVNDTHVPEFIEKIESQISDKLLEYAKMTDKERRQTYHENGDNIVRLTTMFMHKTNIGTQYGKTEFGRELSQFDKEQQDQIEERISKDFNEAGWLTDWVTHPFLGENGKNEVNEIFTIDRR